MPTPISINPKSNPLDPAARSAAPGQFVVLEDGLVHYEIAGPPDSGVVVLIPGFSVPLAIWNPTFEALVEAGFRVLRYDLYGRGFSDKPAVKYNQDLFDRQLFNLLKALEVRQPVDLVGLSMGGAIAAVYADRRPEGIRRLCLIDPAGLPWKRPLILRLGSAPLLGELIMGLLGHRVLVSALGGFFQGGQMYQQLVRDFGEQMGLPGFKKALLSTLRSGVITGAAGAYNRVGGRNTPVLLVWGRDDRLVPFELNERLRELIPKAVFYAVEGAGHIPHFERPEVVSPLLVDFLSS
jgi:pimeloyl-ACP methyl ester carboxylesterase